MNGNVTITLKDGKKRSLEEYLEGTGRKEINHIRTMESDRFSKSLRNRDSSKWIPTRRTTMERNVKDAIIWKIFFQMFKEPKYKFEPKEFAVRLKKSHHAISSQVSRIKNFINSEYVKQRPQLDGVLKVHDSNRKGSYLLSCIALEVDDPDKFTTIFYGQFLEWEREMGLIRKSRKTSVAKNSKKEKPIEEQKEQQEKLIPDQPISFIYNGAPIDIPINLNIKVKVTFEVEN